ncbi:hypothetical protein B5M47_03165 [candidate division CPR3 bacterium 4484_211]|uniref:PIN domain-containing protein n=1 Tax=candidate division CPR3 bacterium 4484_211 TaxID=1968527 RepID=A0A1W9NX96_UNCC3|nr:MAG: hypothetical protein B5M47_03165 [candidate division CPR3 bacterium 4484_211]
MQNFINRLETIKKFRATADTIIAATTYEHHSCLISWDKSLLKQTKKALPSFTPTEYLQNPADSKAIP